MYLRLDQPVQELPAIGSHFCLSSDCHCSSHIWSNLWIIFLQWQSEAWQLWLLMADSSCTDWYNLRHTGRIYDFRRYFLLEKHSHLSSDSSTFKISILACSVKLLWNQFTQLFLTEFCIFFRMRLSQNGCDTDCLLTPTNTPYHQPIFHSKQDSSSNQIGCKVILLIHLLVSVNASPLTTTNIITDAPL